MPPWTNAEFLDQLQRVGERSYHDRHPFHCLMHEGQLTREQVQCWVANRYYYQKNIPIKDAVLLSRCPVREVRRHWVQRIIDHDGIEEGTGGIEKWLRLGEGVGLTRAELEEDRWLLPDVRDAVDSYVDFVRTRSWVEGVASSLTELFAPALMKQRLAALELHYPWIDREALAYFRLRPPLAKRDSDNGLATVYKYCSTSEQQLGAVAALQFKCDLLWKQLDAIHAYSVVGEARRQ